MKKYPDCKELTLYSIRTPFEAFEISMGESFKDFSWIQDFEADFP